MNAAAERYRGVIPADCWHDPYMPSDQLEHDIARGVTFWGYDDGHDCLLGVMGIQAVRDVELIRHAYVRPDQQGRGVGGFVKVLRSHSGSIRHAVVRIVR